MKEPRISLQASELNQNMLQLFSIVSTTRWPTFTLILLKIQKK